MPSPPPTLILVRSILCAENHSCSSLILAQRLLKTDILDICDPMWKWIPISLTFLSAAIFFNTSSISHVFIPNLLSSIPVVIYLWVWASMYGFILNAIGAVLFSFEASPLITSISGIPIRNTYVWGKKKSLPNPLFFIKASWKPSFLLRLGLGWLVLTECTMKYFRDLPATSRRAYGTVT